MYKGFTSAGGCILLVSVLFATDGCSVKRIAVNQVGNALAGSGTVFASDDDPDLVKAAAPFSLKLMESLLAEMPEHEGLLLASCSGFAQYSYAFVQQEADQFEQEDLAKAEELRNRARRLYLRARDYGFRALEARHAGFTNAVRTNALAGVAPTERRDVPLLYWTAASWAGAISLSKDNPGLIAELPATEAMIDRAASLDESFAEGAIHSYLISYEMSRPQGEGDAEARSRRHFQRAVELSGGKQAGPYVALAEAVSVQKQDYREFESLLNQALAINPDWEPQYRLVNIIMQRRAKWLLSRADDLFLNKEAAKPRQ